MTEKSLLHSRRAVAGVPPLPGKAAGTLSWALTSISHKRLISSEEK